MTPKTITEYRVTWKPKGAPNRSWVTQSKGKLEKLLRDMRGLDWDSVEDFCVESRRIQVGAWKRAVTSSGKIEPRRRPAVVLALLKSREDPAPGSEVS